MLNDREFDAPGMATARQELWRLGGTPSKGRRSLDKRLIPAIRKFYPEIRGAREMGLGWKKIVDIIKANMDIPCSAYSVRKYFNQIDAEWEKETGVPALEEPPPKRRRGRSAKKKPKGALEKLEARITTPEEES